MHHIFKRYIRYFSRVLWTPVTLSILLMILSVSGCLSQQEITYQDQINKIRNRYNNLDKNLAKLIVDLSAQMETLNASANSTSPQDFLSQLRELVGTYTPQFQQYLAEFQQLQTDLANIQAPPKFTTAHSIYNSGLSSVGTSINEEIASLDLLAQQPERAEEAAARLKNVPTFLEQGVDNLDEADDMVFTTNWGLIVGVIIGVLAIVGGVIAFFVYISRKRRYQPGYHAGSPAIATPYPSTGYPPPPIDYGPPSEANRQSPPGDIHPAPPIQYQPQQPAGPVPSATKPQTSPQAVRCPRCGAEVTAAGPFCPSCSAMLPGI